MIVAISGNLATGKTTLTRIIEEDLRFIRVAENPQENEFLSDFYRDMERWCLQSQLSFVVSRSLSLLEAQKKGGDIVIDRTASEDVFVFCQALNSYGVLSNRELRIVTDAYDVISHAIPSPDLYVYLEDSTEKIIQRIYRRAIPYEQGIEREYIERINEFYLRWLANINPLKVARISTSEIDFTNAEGRRKILEKLRPLFIRG